MVNKLLDKNFDMDKLIESRLLEIESLEDRKETREIMSRLFKELYHYTDAKIAKLEESVADELGKKEETFCINIGVSTRSTFDVTEGSMFPMVKADMEKVEVSVDELVEAFQQGREVKVFSVFCEMGYDEIKALLEKKKEFHGYIYMGNSQHPITAELRCNTEYSSLVKKLFRVVTNNGFSWNTVCTAYLNKFLDVYLKADEMLVSQEIDNIDINFEEYATKFKFDCFPVWNVEEYTCISEVKKVANIDHAQYQHFFSKYYLKPGFTLIAEEESILTRTSGPEGIVATTMSSDARKWKMYRILPITNMYSAYPILSNKSEGAPIVPARTVGDVFRVVNALGYRDRMGLKDVLFPDVYKAKEPIYSMDKGITEEFEVKVLRQPMVLQFEQRVFDFLSNDILSFIVTTVQRKYPEFLCYGEWLS